MASNQGIVSDTVIIKVVVIRVMTLISAADETHQKERSKVKGNLYHIFTSFQKNTFKAIQFNRFCFLNEGFLSKMEVPF